MISLGGSHRLALEGLSKGQAAALGIETGRECPHANVPGFEVAVLRAGEAQRAQLIDHPTDALRWRKEGFRLEVIGREFVATVTREGDAGPLASLWTPWERAKEFNSVVTNFSRIAITLGDAKTKRCLLHSCATYGEDGRAHLFFGESGAGKTTVGRLALDVGRGVLSDDLNSVGPGEGGRAYVQGFPWAGEFGPRRWDDVRSFPLGAIFRLEQADRHEVVPIRPAAALARLAACSPFVNSDPELYEQLLDDLRWLLESVPAYTLRFRRDPGLFGLVDEVLR